MKLANSTPRSVEETEAHVSLSRAIPKGRGAVQDNVEPMPGRKPVGFEPCLRDLVSVMRADGLVGLQGSFSNKKSELAQAFSTVRRSEIRDD